MYGMVQESLHIRHNTNLSICVQHECAQSNLFLNTHLKRIILNTWREKHNVVIYNTIPRIRAKEISYFLNIYWFRRIH